MSILNKIFSNGATSLVKAVGGVADELLTSKEEKKAIELEEFKAEQKYRLGNRKLDINREKMYLADVADARGREKETDQDPNSTWLSKNIHEVIALIFVLGYVATWFIELPGKTDGIVDCIMLILGYLYGRSKPQS